MFHFRITETTFPKRGAKDRVSATRVGRLSEVRSCTKRLTHQIENCLYNIHFLIIKFRHTYEVRMPYKVYSFPGNLNILNIFLCFHDDNHNCKCTRFLGLNILNIFLCFHDDNHNCLYTRFLGLNILNIFLCFHDDNHNCLYTRFLGLNILNIFLCFHDDNHNCLCGYMFVRR